MENRRKKDRRILGKLEMKIMNELWLRKSATCREIHRSLGSDEYAYTTIMTMLKHLEKKGIVGHSVSGRTFVYKSAVTESDIKKFMLSDFVGSVFTGSRFDMVNTLLRSGNVSPQELSNIERLINEMKKELLND